MVKPVRSFIAIELTRQAHDEFAFLQSALQKAGADVKWVEPDNIHLTLKFLGDLEPKKAEEVKEILIETASGFRSFELAMKDVDAFPDLSSPRIIWAGVGLGAAESARLAENLETKLRVIGIAGDEKKFHPHITLGRVRSPKNYEKLRRAIEAIKFEAGSIINVDHLTFFSSRLSSRGSVYTPLFKVNMITS